MNRSTGRFTLNILLSFAQFEREIISERTKDKISAARRKGNWVDGQMFTKNAPYRLLTNLLYAGGAPPALTRPKPVGLSPRI